jgi:hypothetical protein
MFSSRLYRWLAFFPQALVALFLGSSWAYADLGAGAWSPPADAVISLPIQTTLPSGQRYSTQDITLISGTVVREYATLGAVFAVTWHGPSMPSLQAVLGAPYFARYVASINAQAPGDHRHVGVQDGELVVYSQGRMGHFVGTAYLSTLLPTGLTPTDLQ